MVDLKSEKWDSILSTISVIILGIGTLLGSFSAYQSALYSGESLTKYNQGVATISDANSVYLESNQVIMLDTMVWIEWTKQQATAALSKDPDQVDLSSLIAEQLEDSFFTIDLVEAIDWAEGQNEGKADGERMVSPFESEAYIKNAFKDGEELYSEGYSLLEEGQKTMALGDKLTLVTVYFAIVLFLAGIASSTRRPILRISILASSFLVKIFALTQMLQVPFL